MPERILVFAMKFFEVYNFKSFEVLIFLHITAMTATMSSFGDLIFPLEPIGFKSRSLKSSFDGISDLSLFGGKGWHFGSILFDFIGIFAVAGFRGIAFGVMPGLIALFLDLRFEEVECFIH